jgi:RNA methyltransferase, TrmH family
MNIENYQKISSAQNSWIKSLGKLNSKKYREETRQFSVENLTIIIDALNDGHDFKALFVTEEFAGKHGDKLTYIEMNSQCKNYFLIDPKLNKSYSNLETPSGLTAIYAMADRELDGSSVVYLNGISDPGNLGTIMRSALAFGFANMVLDGNCVDIYNPKVISAAKDAIFKLNFQEDRTGKWINDYELPIYTSSSHAGTSLDEFKPAKVFCLVLGSESHGIGPGVMERAQSCIRIEISDKIESLNVATAAAILLYELKPE